MSARLGVFKSSEEVLPLNGREAAFLLVTGLTGWHQIARGTASPAADRNDVIHRDFVAPDGYLAVITCRILNQILPPARLLELFALQSLAVLKIFVEFPHF